MIIRRNTSWGKVASWYDDLLEKDEESYQERVILPNLLRLLLPYKGKRVLDLACGQGYFSGAFLEAGISVIAADVSRELIALARKKSPKGISYHIAHADRLDFLSPTSLDAAVMVLAIQNIENVPGVFKEAARVLKVGGGFFVVMNHPSFRIPKQSGWGYDDEKKVQYRRLDGYLSESRAVIEMHPGEGRGIKTLSFHRPLQYYIKHLANTGFAVTRLEEWISHKTSDAGPRKSAEDRARKEFPLFLMLQAEKF